MDWLDDGIKAYKTDLVRNDKLRAIYVNGERASMTRRSARPLRSVGNYSVTKGEADWAWISKSGIKEGNVFAADLDCLRIPETRRISSWNPAPPG